MNLSRNMGADIGIAFVTTLIARRAQVHQNQLSADATPYDASFQQRIDGLSLVFQHAGASTIDSAKVATYAVYRNMVQQATQLAYLDALWIATVATALMIPLAWVSQRPQARGAPAGH